MRIACLQFAPQVGDVNNNLNRADAILRRANVEELDLLVLPELAFTGYNFKSLQDISPFLEPSGSGISSLWARTTALKHNCCVVVGYPEKVDASHTRSRQPEYYNSAIVVNAEGETVANYRKKHLYETDEKWALESPKGFYRGHIPELGTAAIGICMDLNPYKFQASWDSFEFAYHIMHARANLVIVSMAWLNDYNGRSLLPQEPDMETLTYWATRLEPVIRAEDDEEVIVVFCNRTGTEDNITYAGTSAVIGIKGGEVCVYGLLGRGDKDVLIVDTAEPPFAKMVLVPETAVGAQTIDSRSDVLESSESNYPATSVSGQSPSFDDNPESFYTQYSSKSSPGIPTTPSTDEEVMCPRRHKPVPPKLRIPEGQRSWSREKSAGLRDPDVRSSSHPKSATPSSARSKAALPFSQSQQPETRPVVSPQSAGASKTYACMPDSGVFMDSAASQGVNSPPPPSHSKKSRQHDEGSTDQTAHERKSGHRRTKSRNSEVSRQARSQAVKSSDHASRQAADEIRSTSFTRAQRLGQMKNFKDSPPVHRIDQSVLSEWLDTLPQKTGDSGYGDMSMEEFPDPNENRYSTMSRESLPIAASPSVFQTNFPQPLDGVLANSDTSKVQPSPAAPDRSLPWKLTTSQSATASSPVFSRMMMQEQPSPAWSEPVRLAVPMAPAYPSPAFSEPVRMGQYSVFDLAEESDKERPPSVILSPVRSADPSTSTDEDASGGRQPPRPARKAHGAGDIGVALTTEGSSASHSQKQRSRAADDAKRSDAADSRRERHGFAVSKSSREGLPTRRTPERSAPSHSHSHGHGHGHGHGYGRDHASSRATRNPTRLVIPSEETLAAVTYTPDPSPASFTSSLDTLSPSNEVPATPLDHGGLSFHHDGPATPKALPLIPDDEDELSVNPLSPKSDFMSFRSMTWGMEKKKPQHQPPQTILDRRPTTAW